MPVPSTPAREYAFTPKKRYASPQEAATILSVSCTTIYRMLDDGQLPSRRVRRSVRIPMHALEPDHESIDQ